MVTPLREQVTEEIRNWIISGELAPGYRLVERELCERLGVSRPTLREAYRLLESDGFIVMTANKGPTVARMSARDARDVYDIREAIECCAVRLFVERASKDQVSDLRGALDSLRVAHRSGEVPRMLAAKGAFYEVLYIGADNGLLWDQAQTLTHRLARLRMRSLSREGRPRESIREIDAVFKAIKVRDAALAESLWRDHIRNAAAAALTDFESPGEERTSRPALPEVRTLMGRRPAAV